MRVLVTGGASGLGAALVTRFAARGDRVLSCDLVAPDPQEQPGPQGQQDGGAGGPVVSRRLDVRSEADWEAARAWVEAEWGGLDLLVNNAGVAGGGRIELSPIEDWEWIVDINLFGVVRGTRAFVPMLKAQGAGRFVNTASLAGLVHPPGMGSYNAVKAAVVAFSETMSHELAPYGVGCTVVCPSYFRTNLMQSMRGADTDLGTSMSKMIDRSPITPDDIAVAVLAGLDRGDDVILPDEPARAAYDAKLHHREAYDEQMRRTATRMKERQG